jgi:predicted dehydrogenase
MVLRIGILGAAGIAPQAVILPARRRDDTVIAAIASRSRESATAYATRHNIPVAHAGYRALLDDPSVDLVYNALPPSEHAEWSIAALEAGKDVLCEKPFAMNASQAEEMAEAARRTGRRLIEAFHDRYHPLSAYLIELVSSGRLGRIERLEATFLADNPFDPSSIRHVPELGGGALMDLGCYPVHWIRSLLGEEPEVISATATGNPLGADDSIVAQLQFPSGPLAQVSASMAAGSKLTATLRIESENGTVEAGSMVFPHSGHSIIENIGGIPRISTVAGSTTYDHQLAAVVRGLATGETLPTEGGDPVANMTVIDAIYAMAGFDRALPARTKGDER